MTNFLSFSFKVSILKSSEKGRQTANGNRTNSIESQPEEECADYLDLRDVQDAYVNLPGAETNKTSDKDSSSSAKTTETINAGEVDENEELPDYVNVVVPKEESRFQLKGGP